MRKLFSFLLVAVTCAGLATAALAEETHSHEHGAASGTPEAPLDIVRDPADLPAPSTAKGPRTFRIDSRYRRGDRQARRRRDLSLLDLQSEGAGSLCARAGRRHRGSHAQEPGGQHLDAQCRFPRGAGTGRRRQGDGCVAGRDEASNSRRSPASTSIIARRRWPPSTSPTACTA